MCGGPCGPVSGADREPLMAAGHVVHVVAVVVDRTDVPFHRHGTNVVLGIVRVPGVAAVVAGTGFVGERGDPEQGDGGADDQDEGGGVHVGEQGDTPENHDGLAE